MELLHSKHAKFLPSGQLLLPSIGTVSAVWPTEGPQNLEHMPVQVRVMGTHQALLTSILAIRILTIPPDRKSLQLAVKVRTPPDLAWRLSCIIRFWSVASPYLHFPVSPSKSTWTVAFLDTISQMTSSLASTTFEALIASRFSSLISQITAAFLLRPESTELPHTLQKSLCSALFEIALLVQKSPKWYPLLSEQLSPTLRKIDNKDGKVSGDLNVSPNGSLVGSWAHCCIVCVEISNYVHRVELQS